MARNTGGFARSGISILEHETEGTFETARRNSPKATALNARSSGQGQQAGEPGPGASARASDPLYPVALLKIAMAMKRLPPEEALHFDQILEDVLHDLLLDEDDFRTYLARNKGRLMTAVRSRGY